jgi:hypothetical protein
MFWDHCGIESCGGEVVLFLVNNCVFEDITSLLGGTLFKELVVHLDERHISLIAWNDGSLLPGWTFACHVIVGSSIEMVV